MNPNLGHRIRHDQYKLLICLKKGMYASQISRQLKTPRQTIHDRIKTLLSDGLIKVSVKSSATFYSITRLGYICLNSHESEISRYLRGENKKNKTRLHRLNIKFPILKDNKNVIYTREYKLNNWIQRYMSITYPIGITIKKTTKSIIAMFHEFETKRSNCLTDFFSHIIRGSSYVYYYLLKEQKITIDIFAGIITDQHIVNEASEFEGRIDKKKTTLMDLARKSKSIFPTNLDAKAWLDHSTGIPEIETNDFLYEEKLLKMPEYIETLATKTAPIMHELTRQIALHIQVQKDMHVSVKRMGDLIETFISIQKDKENK